MTEQHNTDRKARLAALAARAGRNNVSSTPESESPEEARDKVAFRNYQPRDASLQVIKETKPGDEQALEGKKRKLEVALEEAQLEIRKNDSPSAPTTTSRKINWDLKRDILPQLNRLEKRTERAIVELLKERLAKEASEEWKQNNLD